MPRERLTQLIGRDVSNLVRGSAFVFSCRIFGAVAAFVAQVLLARWMGAAEMGHYVLAYSWLVILAFLPVGGYIGAAMRFIGHGLASEDHGYVRGFVRHATTVVLLVSLTIVAIGVAVVENLPAMDGAQRTLFLIALVGVPFLALIKLDSGLAIAFSRFGLSFLPNDVIRPSLFLAGIASIWYLGYALDAQLTTLVHVVAIVALGVPLAVYLRTSIAGRLAKASARYERSLWNRTALGLLLLGLFAHYFPELTVITIGFFLPSADIGIYNAAFRIAMLINFGLFAIDAFVAPALSRHLSRGERTELLRVVRQATLLRFVGAFASVLFLIAAGEGILGIFGEQFVRGYVELILLALAQLALAAVGPSVRMLSIAGFQNQGLYASAGALGLWMLLAALLLPDFGVTGAAISTLLSLTAWSAALRYLVIRHLEMDVLVLVRDLKTS